MRLYKESVLAVITVVGLSSISVAAKNGVVNQPTVSSSDTAADSTAKTDYGLPWGLDKLPEIRNQASEMEFADQEAKTKLLDILDTAGENISISQAGAADIRLSNRLPYGRRLSAMHSWKPMR